MPDKIDFSANINPFGMPESVILAAKKGIEDSIYYPDVASRKLKQAIAEKEKIPQDTIVLGNGAAELLFAICQAIKPMKALLCVPTFQEYEQALQSVGCECVFLALEEANGYKMDVLRLKEQISSQIDLLFLCNPNNPTGVLTSNEDLTAIVETCKQHQVLCVIDECFLAFTGEVKSMVTRLSEYENLIIIKAFTKLYAMPGLRLGYGMMDERVAKEVKRCMQPWNLSVPAQYAGVAALKEEKYVRDSIQYINQEKNYLLTELRKHAICKEIYESSANFIFFKANKELYDYLWEKGYLLRDCSNYRNLTEGYYRMAIRTHEENKSIIACMKEWKAEQER